MSNEKANMAQRYEREIPEGYEARIEGNKVIIEKKEDVDEKIRRGLLRCLGDIAGKLFALYGISKNDALAYLEKQKEQKPAEWSEEDEKMFNVISYKISQHQGKGERDLFTPDEAEFMYELECRLKSLRPQPHWKPSEEQMKALLSKLPVVKGSGDKVQDILESLYSDLKKL